MGSEMCIRDRVFHRFIRAIRFITDQDVAGTTGDNVSFYGINLDGVIRKSGEIVIFSIVFVQFGCPNLGFRAHPGVRISFSYTIRAFPTGKVFTFPEEAAGTGHVISGGFLIGQYARVTQVDGIERDVGTETVWDFLLGRYKDRTQGKYKHQ